jgi:hypothetical protein
MAASRNRRLNGWRVVGVNDNQTNEYPGRMGFHKVEKKEGSNGLHLNLDRNVFEFFNGVLLQSNHRRQR